MNVERFFKTYFLPNTSLLIYLSNTVIFLYWNDLQWNLVLVIANLVLVIANLSAGYAPKNLEWAIWIILEKSSILNCLQIQYKVTKKSKIDISGPCSRDHSLYEYSVLNFVCVCVRVCVCVCVCVCRERVVVKTIRGGRNLK